MKKKLEDLVERTLLGVGLVKSKLGALPPFWSRGEDTVSQFFAPAVVSRHGQYQLHGIIGVVVWRFEQWWEGLLRSAPPDGGASDSFLFSIYLTNLRELMEAPTFSAEGGGLEEWIAKVWADAERLPNSYDTLFSALAAGRLLNIETAHFWGHPVKRLGFARWLERESGMSVSIDHGRITRTEPYTEVLRMLETLH